MTDSRTGMPQDHEGHADKQGQGVQGLAGERTEDRGIERPELRRTVETDDGDIEVEDTSGSAFAEAKGAASMSPPDPEAKGDVEDNSLPANAKPRPEA